MKHPYETVAPVSRFKRNDRVRITPAAWVELFGGKPDEPGRELVTGTVTGIHHAGIVGVHWDRGSEKPFHEDHLEAVAGRYIGSTSDPINPVAL